MSDAKTTEEIVHAIRAQLREVGIHVGIQSAVNTTSKYLAFDYGVLKRARVGDHPSKPRFNYRFEIGNHINGLMVIEKTFRDHTYDTYRIPANEIDVLVEILCEMRDDLHYRYGESGYQAILDRNRKRVEGSDRKSRYRNGQWRSRRAA
jgi:hypothetical protein